MRPGWVKGVSLVLTISAMAHADSAITIVALGDSTTAGTPFFQSPLERPPEGAGDPEGQYSYWMMRRHPEWQVLNFGIAGQRTDEIYFRMDDALQMSPRFIVILAGVNDIYQNQSLRAAEDNLMHMYKKAKARGALPIAVTVLPMNEATPAQAQAIQKLNGWIRKAADKERIPLADLNKLLADPKNPDRLVDSPDGYPPDVGGYRKMGQALARLIEPFTTLGRH
jgi:lysophospholipase L1-like esterase